MSYEFILVKLCKITKIKGHYFFLGNVGDSFSSHNGMKFTTKDSDNDKRNNANCAKQFRGGWWFHSCYSALLCSNRIGWSYWGGSKKLGEMKIKP